MKRLIAMLLIVAVFCCMFMTAAFATGVTSPEQGNTDVDTQPSSPQTGGLPLWVYIIAAVVLLGAVLLIIRKAMA